MRRVQRQRPSILHASGTPPRWRHREALGDLSRTRRADRGAKLRRTAQSTTTMLMMMTTTTLLMTTTTATAACCQCCCCRCCDDAEEAAAVGAAAAAAAASTLWKTKALSSEIGMGALVGHSWRRQPQQSLAARTVVSARVDRQQEEETAGRRSRLLSWLFL
jgi:hypothetical protein